MIGMRSGVIVSGIATALLVAGCAAARVSFPSQPAAGSIFNAFDKPDGPGPFPAVVLLHTCGGIRPHVRQWSSRLVQAGYATLIVDSFTWRGAAECSIPHVFPASIDEVAGDAFAALRYLRGRPDVDPGRIGVMGFSWGANATLRTSSARYRRDEPGRGFAAAIAFYPMCVSPRADWPAAAQERANNLLRKAGRPVDIVLYPGAGHVFDSRDSPNSRKSAVDTLAFLGRHLQVGR
jgi:dienelactone hydrolase